MKRYVPKEEFRRRLVKLHEEIVYCLIGTHKHRCLSLFPALASVFMYMWCKNVNDMFKQIDDDKEFDVRYPDE